MRVLFALALRLVLGYWTSTTGLLAGADAGSGGVIDVRVLCVVVLLFVVCVVVGGVCLEKEKRL